MFLMIPDGAGLFPADSLLLWPRSAVSVLCQRLRLAMLHKSRCDDAAVAFTEAEQVCTGYHCSLHSDIPQCLRRSPPEHRAPSQTCGLNLIGSVTDDVTYDVAGVNVCAQTVTGNQ